MVTDCGSSWVGKCGVYKSRGCYIFLLILIVLECLLNLKNSYDSGRYVHKNIGEGEIHRMVVILVGINKHWY